MPEPEAAGWVSAKFEYVVACQMYHPFKASDEPKVRDPTKVAHIDALRHRFPARLRVAYVEVLGQGKEASFAG